MKVSSDSFLAPAINCSRVSAAGNGGLATNREKKVKKPRLMACSQTRLSHHFEATLPSLVGGWYFPPEHEPRSRTRLVQQIFMRYKTDHLVLLRVPDHAQRIQTFLNRFDGFLIETTQKNNAAIRITQMFLSPVVDQPLAFLRNPVLVSSREPVDRFIPFVDSGFAFDKSLLSVIFHDLSHRFSVDDSAEFHREVHRVGVVDGNTPTHHFTRAARLMLAGMSLFDIAGFVHDRHDKKINVSIPFSIGNAPRIIIQNAILESLRIDLAVIPRRSRARPMQPAQMILIHGIFDHLKKIAIHCPRSPRSNSIFPHQHIESRQQRGRLRAKIGKNDPAQLLSLVGRVTNTLSEGTVGRLTRRFQNSPIDVVKPAMVAAAQPAILEMTEFQRSAAMRAAKRQQSQPVLLIAKKHEILAQNSSAQRLSFQFIDKRDRKPITAQHFSGRRSRPNPG